MFDYQRDTGVEKIIFSLLAIALIINLLYGCSVEFVFLNFFGGFIGCF